MIRIPPSIVTPASQRPPLAKDAFALNSNIQPNWTDRYEKQLQIVQRELETQPRYADSLAFQTRWRTGLDPYYFEQKRDEKSTLSTMRKAAWERIDWFIRYYAPHFQSVVENENDNWDFYSAFQWDDQQLAKIQKQRLIPHVANYMARWARTLLGEERGAQTVYNYQAADIAMKQLADLYNQVVPKICDMNEWAHKSSSDFANLSIGGRCFSSVRPDPYDPMRKILMRSERPQEFLYDFENAENGTLDGCSELVRTYYVDLEDLVYRYPEWEQFLRTYDYSQFAGYENLLLFTVAQPKVAPTASKRTNQVPAKFIQRPYYRHRRVAWVTEHYTKGGLEQWTVTDFNFNVDYDFDAADQAVLFYRNLRDGYAARNVALTGQPGLDLVAPPERIIRKVVDQELWVADTLVDLKTTKVPRFPYLSMHNEFHRGEWRGFFQDDKYNQQTRNRMMIYLDMILGGVKGKNFYDLKLFPKGTTPSQAEDLVRDPMKHVISDWPNNFDAEKHHLKVDPPASNAALAETVLNIVDKASAFGNGGLNSIGDAEFAGQSDKLRRGLQESSQTGTVPLMSDWEWHEERVGQQLAYTSQHLHPVALLGYVNADSREELLPLLQKGEHTIEMDSLSCSVSEILAGPRKRDQQKNTLIQMIQQDPEGAQDIRPELLALEDLPDAMIQRIEQRKDGRMQAQSDQMQHEQQMAEFELQKKMQISERKVAVEERHVAVAENPPVAYAVSAKANAPGPDAMAEIYKQHRIDALPANVLASEAKQDLKDQARDDLRQASANKQDLTYQRDLSKIWPKEPAKGGSQYKKKSGGSAKDKSARSRKGAEKPKTRV